MVGREVVEAFGAARSRRASTTPRSTSATATAVLGARSAPTHPDAIVHCAAMTAVDACESERDRAFLVNALGVRFVMEGARRAGAYIVDAVDRLRVRRYATRAVSRVGHAESRHRCTGSRSSAASSRSTSNARSCARRGSSAAYGANMAKTILRLAGGDAPLRFVDDQRGCPTVAADLATMLRTFVVERLPGTWHVTNQGAGQLVRVRGRGVARRRTTTRRASSRSPPPISTRPAPAPRPANSVLDNRALRLSGRAAAPRLPRIPPHPHPSPPLIPPSVGTVTHRCGV